jgi:hypothetical protein
MVDGSIGVTVPPSGSGSSREGGRIVFEKHKAKRADEESRAALAAWQSEHDELTAVIQAATTRQGSPSTDIILTTGESVFGAVSNASLVEDRRGPGHYAGTSQGISIPVASVGGRSIRYRVGASRGHFVQGDLHPEAVDAGKLVITNQRVLFLGSKKTVECAFAKLVSVNVEAGDIYLSVSNREKVTRIHFGSRLDGWVHLRLALAMSVGRGDTDQFAAQVQAQLNELDAKKPVQPQVSA